MSETNFDVVRANAFIGADIPYQGKRYFVNPRTGLDGNSGRSPRTALKTLAAALAKCTANQNDVVYLLASSNTSADTTDYLTAQLDWNKDLVHLIGVGSGVAMSPRSRIAAVSGYATAAPIMTVSANGCRIENVQIYMGVASVTPLGALSVTGKRNLFSRCHILGMGAATNDIAGAYSLLLSGAEENEFHNCIFGSDRTILGANANAQILCAALSINNRFIDCEFRIWTASATNTVFVRAATGSLQGVLEFVRCRGINSTHRAGGTALTYGMVVASDAGGDVILDLPTQFQAADVNSTDAGNVYGPTAAAGIAIPLLK